MKKLNRKSVSPPPSHHFNKTCPCTILPPPFIIFQIPLPPPPPLKRERGSKLWAIMQVTISCIYAGFEVVLCYWFVGGFFCCNYAGDCFVAIVQLEVSSAHMKVTVSAANMWVTISIAIMQMGVSVAIMQVVFSTVHYALDCFYCNYASNSFFYSYVSDSFR